MLFEVSVSFSYLCINQTSFSPNGGKLNTQNSCPSHFSSLLYQRSIAPSPVWEKKNPGRVPIVLAWPIPYTLNHPLGTES